MKRVLFYLSALIVLGACSNNTKEVKEEKNVIHLAEAIANPVKMNLSEIVDSIKFVPISSKEHFIKDAILIDYVKPYLVAYPGCVYNMQGEFVGYVGKFGQGPGEESSNNLRIIYDENKKLFYSRGDKIIQYHHDGKFTGSALRSNTPLPTTARALRLSIRATS